MAIPKRAPEVEERDPAIPPTEKETPEKPGGTKKRLPGRGKMLRTLGLGMITGAADDGRCLRLSQVIGLETQSAREAVGGEKFYVAIAAFTVLAMGINF